MLQRFLNGVASTTSTWFSVILIQMNGTVTEIYGKKSATCELIQVG